jgi:hypothetical protein
VDPNQIEYSLKLSPPAYLTIESADGEYSTRVDIFQTWRFLEDAAKQPSQDARWATIRKYLAGLFKCEPDLVAESTAREFHDAIVNLGTRAQEQIQGKLSSIVSLQQPTPESQADTPDGQSS